jgi:hypothetical protein
LSWSSVVRSVAGNDSSSGGSPRAEATRTITLDLYFWASAKDCTYSGNNRATTLKTKRVGRIMVRS